MGTSRSKPSQNPERVLARDTSKVRVPQMKHSDTSDGLQAASSGDNTLKQDFESETPDGLQAASGGDNTLKQDFESETPDPLVGSSSGVKVKPCNKYF